MLGLLPLFFIARFYYQLAHEHNRSKWGFAFLGVGIALFAQILVGLVFGIVLAMKGETEVTNNGVVISWIALFISILVVLVVYKLLEKNWSNHPKNEKVKEDLLDQ